MANEKDTSRTLFSDLEQELTPEDYQAFLRLAENKDFVRLERLVEGFLLSRAYDLIANRLEIPSAEYAVWYLRGGHDLWRAATRLLV